MLPMIAVAGTHNVRRFNSRWNRAAAPAQWWQNPSLSFGSGAPVQVASTSVQVDAPPIQANPTDKVCREMCGHHGIGIKFHKCYQDCMGLAIPGQPTGRRPGRGRVAAGPGRRRRRMVASARRRNVSVGHGHGGGSCCGGGCPGCKCGSDRAQNGATSRMRPTQANPSTVARGGLIFSPPTTSRLLNRATGRRAARMRAAARR